jgi:hypothetical protein
MTASLMGVGLIVWWVVRRAPHRVDVATPADGDVTASRYPASDEVTAAGRCAACRAAIVEQDSLFCPRCGARLTDGNG